MRRSSLALSRSVFLACSWTWCIGMFLPVFLVKDFGVWGWVAFALPNVVGAAAVGLIVRTPPRSKQTVERHAPAMRVFSAVTIAFHFYFLGQILRVIDLPTGPMGDLVAAGGLIALAALAVWATGWLKTTGWLWFAVATLALSALAGALMYRMSSGHAYAPPPNVGEYSMGDLLWFSPALFFGFLLCPHLDLTFHRVRQEAPGRDGDIAFLIGFCVFFLGLIAFSLAYVASFLGIAWLNSWILLHFFIQSVFTTGAHRRELKSIQPGAQGRLVAVIVIAGVVMGLFWPADHFRLGYDLILYAYTIPFPAYVWIVMIPRRRKAARPAFATWLYSVAGATPIFALGYLGHVWWLIPVSIALPLLAPIVHRPDVAASETH